MYRNTKGRFEEKDNISTFPVELHLDDVLEVILVVGAEFLINYVPKEFSLNKLCVIEDWAKNKVTRTQKGTISNWF